MKKFIRYIEKTENFLMILGLFISLIILFVQVILRFVFNASLSWIEELARYLFVYFTWIGTSIAVSSNEHIRVEMLYTKFPKMSKIFNVINYVVCMGVSLFMVVYGSRLVNTLLGNVALSPTMRIPMWICYLVIPISGLLMTIKFVYKLMSTITLSPEEEALE